ncbi:MAG TPA: serine/threonine-protein kinase [Polyangia bacterium]|nr:serine/threonine-protein kinase [Polyangia bacterium]
MSEKAAFHRFGRYIVLRTLGGGGMGRVDLALDRSLDPPELRVLKTMNTDEPNLDAEARFRREANIAMQLSHDAIAHTHAIENIDGELCLVQEFVEGVDLSLLERQAAPKRFPISSACFVVSEVARALAHAHGKGVIHRDVTPNNVMVGYTGGVKLIDFGIARSVTDPKLTQLGVIVGREVFIPPEVSAGGPADQRADVYALGVVLWEMLVGRKMVDVVQGDEVIPEPSSLVADVPSDLSAIVSKALARAPGDRFQSAEELRENLGAFYADEASARTELVDFVRATFDVDRDRKYLEEDVEEAKRSLGGPQSSGARSVPRRPAWLVLGASLAAVIGAAGVAVALRTRPSPPPPVTPTAAQTVVPVAVPQPAAPESTPKPADHSPEARSARTTPPRKLSENAHPMSASAAAVPVAGDERRRVADLLHEANRRWTAGAGDEGIALARQAARRGAGAPAHVLIGTILMSKHDVPAAEREFAEAVKLDPNDEEARRLLDFAKRQDGD